MERKALTTMLHIVQDICIDGACSAISIEELNNTRVALQIELEKRDVMDFLKHVKDAMPADDTEEAWDAFYDKSFRICFDGKSVELHMDATIYQNITDALEEYIEDQYLDGRTFTQSRKMYGCMQRIKTDLNRITEVIKDKRNYDEDAYHHAIHDIKDTMSGIIDELLEIFKS